MLPSTVYCDTCGAANRPQARFCTACGQGMPVASPSLSSTGLLASYSLLNQRYHILRPLGQGGMGAVYQVEDTRLGNRLLAIKEMSLSGLKSQQEIDAAAETFKREALMLAGLFHRNLPRIYDHFEDGGRWYLVMDYIAGETLEEYLAKAGGQLPVEKVLDIGIQLCTVLSYLHTHQPPIIFRDLKPANAMRTLDGDLYLIDFGIARHFKPGQAKDTVAFGSPGYAAPEQYGKAQTTVRSDIYSMGAMLHQMLTGDNPSLLPFQFASLSSVSIPAPLRTLIMRMVTMDANQRPASMAEVRQELHRLAAQPGGSQLQPIQLADPKSLPKPTRASPSLGTVLCTYRSHSGFVLSIVWSPDGTRIASASYDAVQIWDAATGKTALTYREQNGGVVIALSWSPYGTRIVSSNGQKGNKGVQRIWDADTGKNLLTYGGHSKYAGAVAWSPDSTRIVSGSTDGSAQIWNATTGKTLLTYSGHSGLLLQKSVNAVAWSADGQYIASGGGDQTVQVWEAVNGTIICKGQHTKIVAAVAWSQDSRRVASGSYDKTVQVWNANSGKTLLTYSGHAADVHAIAWSPDGTRIASASKDKTVQIWDAATGRQLFTFRGHTADVLAIAWSPDSTRIASGGGNLDVSNSRDTMVRVWQAV